jgi:uncharacterized protein
MTEMVIDAIDFARQQEHREGQTAIANLLRLAKESVNAAGTLHWSLAGGSGKFGYPQLTLKVSATVQSVCQRCLTPFELEITSESVIILAKNDADADKIEELLDDDELDVIVGSREMNLFDLVEDEALLALPLSPRHEVCPEASKLDGIKTTKPSPFAVLRDLKQKS